MTPRRGLFVVIDGPSGIGKTTVTGLLATELAGHGVPITATNEPTDSPLGKLARHGTAELRGHALACLVAADRYWHLEQEVRPALLAGRVVICDRYIPSSLVLQRFDGVQSTYVLQLHQHADIPDLTVILTGDPARSRAHAQQRGVYSRFHGIDPAAEAALYRNVARDLRSAGWPVLHHEIGDKTSDAVVAALRDAVLVLL